MRPVIERRRGGRYSKKFTWSVAGVASLIIALQPVLSMLAAYTTTSVNDITETHSNHEDILEALTVRVDNYERRLDVLNNIINQLDFVLEDNGFMNDGRHVVTYSDTPPEQDYKFNKIPELNPIDVTQRAFFGAVDFILATGKNKDEKR